MKVSSGPSSRVVGAIPETTSGLIDAHCHLTDDRVWPEAKAWIERARANGVTRVRVGGLYPSEWSRQTELKKTDPDFIRTSFGLHPWWIEQNSRAEIEAILAHLESELEKNEEGIQAIGETGLDFFSKRDASRFADQEFAFRAQLKLAQKFRKPLVLHVVKAHEEVLKIIQDEGLQGLKFQVHSFSGSEANARAWIKMGAFLSFSGGFKRDHGDRLRKILKATPRSQILLETDAPDQAWRKDGKNEPCMIGDLYRAAAQVLDLPVSSLTEILAENFARFG